MGLGAPELIIIFTVLVGMLVGIGVPLYAFVDVIRTPDGVWRAAGQDRIRWALYIGIGFLLCGVIGLIMAIVYLASVRPQLRRSAVG